MEKDLLPDSFCIYSFKNGKLGVGRRQHRTEFNIELSPFEMNALYKTGINVLHSYIPDELNRNDIEENNNLTTKSRFFRLYESLKNKDFQIQIAVYDIVNFPATIQLYKKLTVLQPEQINKDSDAITNTNDDGNETKTNENNTVLDVMVNPGDSSSVITTDTVKVETSDSDITSSNVNDDVTVSQKDVNDDSNEKQESITIHKKKKKRVKVDNQS